MHNLGNTEDRGYAYEAAWNLNYRTNNGSLSTFTLNTKNELTNAFVAPYFYDSNGNLIAAGSSTNTLYVYDDENQLMTKHPPLRVYPLGTLASLGF